MLLQTLLFLGQLWQLFEVSQILGFLRYMYSAFLQMGQFLWLPVCFSQSFWEDEPLQGGGSSSLDKFLRQ